MKKTLTQHVQRQLIGLGCALALAAIAISTYFSWRSIEQTSNHLMWLEAESLAKILTHQPDFKLPSAADSQIYSTWNRIPHSIRQHFSEPSTLAHNTIVETVINTEQGKQYVFLLRYNSQHKTANPVGDKPTNTQINTNNSINKPLDFWLVSQHSEDDIQRFIDQLFHHSLLQAIGLTLLIFMLLFFWCRWIIRQSTQPLMHLSQWAEQLAHQPDTEIPNNFSMRETYDLAQQLSASVEKIHQSNERERFFLQSASHELRTPLATLQASLDTLELLTSSEHNKPLERAQKSCSNMSLLTTTLLWLSRPNESSYPKENIEINGFINTIINKHHHITGNHPIHLYCNQAATTLIIESQLLDIVVSNMLKNAIQYTDPQPITINVNHDSVVIKNTTHLQSEDGTIGFGLGLQLVGRICHKLSWSFTWTQNNNKVIATLRW